MRGFITSALCFQGGRGEAGGSISRPSLLRYPHVFEIYAAASRGPSLPFPSISSARELLNLPEDEAHLRHIVGGSRGWVGAVLSAELCVCMQNAGQPF